MTPNRQPSIAVVGAGIGGLAAAAALRRVGIEVDVYEQAARFTRVGAGIQVTPNVVKVLRGIGLEETVRAHGFEAYSQLIRDGVSGAVVRELVMLAERFGAPYLCMHRADLHGALGSVLPGERIHLNKKLVGLEHGGSGVALSFADRSTASADAVVGADGMHSVVREHVAGSVCAVYNGRSAYRGVLPAARLDRDVGSSRTMWSAADRQILTYYTKRDRSELCFVTGQPDSGEWMTRESWSATGEVQWLREEFDGFHADVRALLAACTECHVTGTSYLDPLTRWSDGRAVLLGDACHTMAPRMAQGAAMAIEDAAVLARCIADSGGEDLEGAFERYEAHRKPRTSLVHALASDPQAAARRGENDMGWLYGYNAWAVTFETAPIQPDSAAAV